VHLLLRQSSGKLDAAGYERLVTLAGQTINSDYELAELLIAISKTQPLTERMQAGFVTAAKSISSDYERHRVLSAALSRPGLTPANQSAMLDAAGDIAPITSGRAAHRAEQGAADRRGGPPAYFKAANSLQPDYEHRRVLDAVVRREMTAMIADVLQSAQAINYELAELLIKIGSSYPLDDALRPPYFSAAGRSILIRAWRVAERHRRGDVLNLSLRGARVGEGPLRSRLAELLLAVMSKVKSTTRSAPRSGKTHRRLGRSMIGDGSRGARTKERSSRVGLGDPVLSFLLQQGLLALQSPAVATERAVVSDNPVTRNHQCHRICRARSRHRSGRSRLANTPRNVRIGASLAEGDSLQLLPHPPLKCRRSNIERQVEIRLPAIEVGKNRRDPAVQLAALILHDPCGGKLGQEIRLEWRDVVPQCDAADAALARRDE
jgi:hypothetical protein